MIERCCSPSPLGYNNLLVSYQIRGYDAPRSPMVSETGVNMTPARLQTIEGIFHSALAQRPDEVGAFLDTACAGDALLRINVETLLAFTSTSPQFH